MSFSFFFIKWDPLLYNLNICHNFLVEMSILNLADNKKILADNKCIRKI